MHQVLLGKATANEAIVGTNDGADVLEPPIPRSVRFAQAPAAGRTLVTSGRAGKGAVAYRTVAATLASRLTPPEQG